MNTSVISRSDLWKQYEIQVDLYKHYLKLAIEINVFYYAITGGILSYYLAHKSDGPIRFALILPILMALFIAILFVVGGFLNKVSRQEMFDIRDELGLKSAPEFAVLSWLLWILAALMSVVAISLGAMYCGYFG